MPSLRQSIEEKLVCQLIFGHSETFFKIFFACIARHLLKQHENIMVRGATIWLKKNEDNLRKLMESDFFIHELVNMDQNFLMAFLVMVVGRDRVVQLSTRPVPNNILQKYSMSPFTNMQSHPSEYVHYICVVE